jgi:DNA transformation protein and related proteins
MTGSPAFQRIQRDVLRLCAAIPAGRVCTYADLGAVIDVPARHVAYIVARLDDATRLQHPVHRLVGAAGKLPTKPADVAALLHREGVLTAQGHVAQLSAVQWLPSADAAPLERTTRPPEHTRSGGKAQGAHHAKNPHGAQPTDPALSELRGLGPASVAMLVSVGITTAAQLRHADLYQLYARIKAQHPHTSINLLYAMMGAVDGMDWRDVAKERRTEVLMQLEDRGLLKQRN